ncbi:MAG: hypothetical protein WAT12_10230 [Candidatus Nitrotoga sp.]
MGIHEYIQSVGVIGKGANIDLSTRFVVVCVSLVNQDFIRDARQAWLLIEWLKSGAFEPTKCILFTTPDEATLKQLVFITQMRWQIKREYQDLIQDFVLYHCERKGWRWLHNHGMLRIVVLEFL